VSWTTLTGAGGLVVRDGRILILDRWWGTGTTGFHVHADVSVHADGTQSYVFGP
jgi:hypothetical protein